MSGDDEENQQTKGSDKQSWLEQNPAKRSLWPKKQDGSHEPFSSRTLQQAVCTYFLRWKGIGKAHPRRPNLYRAALAFLGSFLSLLLIAGMQQWINYNWSLPMLLATFGPGAALIYGLPTLPASQPLNCFGGTVVCGVIGLFWRVLVGRETWIAVPLCVSTSVAALEILAIPFPPGDSHSSSLPDEHSLPEHSVTVLAGIPLTSNQYAVACSGMTMWVMMWQVFSTYRAWLTQNTFDCVGIATSILMVTLVPESEFQPTTLAATHAAHNWCIRPLLEHSLLLRFTQGCKIFLAAVIGQLVLLVVSLFVNNLDPYEGYPDRWL